MLLRVVLFFVVLFAVLFLWRALRHLAHVLFGPPERGGARRRRVFEQEMVRDPVCGAWVDRRLAVVSSLGGEPVALCSEGCRRELEARKSRP